MAKIINISDKLSQEKSKIVIGKKEYIVDDSMQTVLKFEELASKQTMQDTMSALELALGKKAVKEMEIEKMSVANFQVIVISIMAAMQDMEYDEAVERFRNKTDQQ